MLCSKECHQSTAVMQVLRDLYMPHLGYVLSCTPYSLLIQSILLGIAELSL